MFWHLCVGVLYLFLFYFILFSLSKLFNVFVIHLLHCLAPGRGMVSFHAHHGPVKFLTMATAVCNVSQATMATLTSNTPSQCQPGAPEVEGTQLDENCSGVGCSSTSFPSHVSVLQDSLSSSCGSLALSQGSLEHGPEDGVIYDLLNEPAHFQKAKQTEKVNVSSLLVVSGGLGHRRINRKTKQSKHEEMVSTILVWQIPLPSLWEKKRYSENGEDQVLVWMQLHKHQYPSLFCFFYSSNDDFTVCLNYRPLHVRQSSSF